jgi:dTDP-4-dehydrorhamnose 3,5-epimerase
VSIEFIPLSLPEVVLIKPRVFRDERGFFFEAWQQQRYSAAGIDAPFLQDNHSHSTLHTLRGLHYQIEQPQGKLVRVAHGSVYDVAVDMRRSSPRFGQWVGVELSAANSCMLWVPPGFAHGYLTLSESADFLYKCTDYYAPQHERAVRWNDPHVGVDWPLPDGIPPRLSPKDAVAPAFADAACFP